MLEMPLAGAGDDLILNNMNYSMLCGGDLAAAMCSNNQPQPPSDEQSKQLLHGISSH